MTFFIKFSSTKFIQELQQKYKKDNYNPIPQVTLNENTKPQLNALKSINKPNYVLNSQATPNNFVVEETKQKNSFLPDVLNFGERAGATVVDVIDDVSTGFAKGIEGIIDFLIGVAGEIGGLFGADKSWAEEALIEGADLDSAMAYGTLSGLTETIIEMASGGIGGIGKGWISKLAPNFTTKLTVKFASSTLAKLVINSIGEGMEEVAGDWIDPYLKRLTYDKDAPNATIETLFNSFMAGALASGIMQSVNIKMTKKSNRIYSQMEELIDMQVEAINSKQYDNANFIGKLVDQKYKQLETELAKDNIKLSNIDTNVYNKDTFVTDKTIDELEFKPVETNVELTNEQKNNMLATRQLIKKFNAKSDIKTDLIFTNKLPNNVDGAYRNGVMYVNINAKSPYKTILKHELTHSLESGKNYNEFKDYAISMLKQTGEYDTLKAEIQTKYKNELVKQSNVDEYIDQEIVANFSERLFEDEASIKNLVSEKRNIAQKIYDWIKEKLSILTGKSKEEIELKKQLRKAEELFKKALMESNASNQEYMMLSNDEIKYGLKKSRYEIIDKYIMQKNHISLTINDKKINASIDENTLKKNFRLPINSTNAGFNAKVRNYQSFYEIIENSKYVESKPETNPQKNPYHNDIINWHIFRTNFADNLGTYDVITFISENTNHQYRIYESVWKK